MGTAPRATFVYPNPRAKLLARVASGREPDSTLLGANHLGAHGIDARIHDPLLTRRDLRPPFDRIAWNLRELTLPFELGRSDVVFTPLANIFPLAARARGLPVVVVNYGLNLIWRRASKRRRALLGRSLRAAACVVSLGESQRIELMEAVGIPAAPRKALAIVRISSGLRPCQRSGAVAFALSHSRSMAGGMSVAA